MNCKPHDLAYIVGAYVTENIGKVVEIIRIDTSVAPFDIDPGSARWVCRTRSECCGVDRSTGERTVIRAGEEMSTYDYWLRPISGVPVDVEVFEDLKESA